MEAVAGAAEVSRRTVFNHFESKEALFRAAMERLWARLPVIEIADDEAALSDPRNGLARMGAAIAEFWTQPEAIPLARMVIAEGGRFPFLREGYSQYGRLPAQQALTRYFEALHRRGLLHMPDPERAAVQFVGVIKDPLWWPVIVGMAKAPTSAKRMRMVEEAVSIFLRSYAPQPAG